MSMNALSAWALASLISHGAPILLLTAYIGSLGIPFPITLVVIAAGAITRQGLLDWRLAVLACLAGAALADNSEYLLGRLAGRWLKRRFEHKSVWQQAMATFKREGGWAILLTRFWLTTLAPEINMIAGSRYPYLRFLFFDLIGELLWVFLYGGLGYIFAAQWEAVSQTMSWFSGLSMTLVILAGLIFFLGKRRKKARRCAEGRLPVPSYLTSLAAASNIQEIYQLAGHKEYDDDNSGEYNNTGVPILNRYSGILNLPESSQPLMLPQPSWSCCPTVSELENLATDFSSIQLDQMNEVALLDRIDTKFVITYEQLLSALAHLQSEYWMLVVGGRRLIHYRSLYFDTPDFALYQAQVNGRAERYKVRSREYTDTHLSFLEVKHTTRKGRTIKDRLMTDQPVRQMTRDLQNWLLGVSVVDGGALELKVWNTFTRITLVNKQRCERVTLDSDLAFFSNDRLVQLDGIAVAEVKMNACRAASPFISEMRAQRIRQRGFSKYAIGVSMLYDRVKKNTLKSKRLWLDKMMKGSVIDE
jgi:membrane protein DedA with SNARE-associated domain